MPPHHPRDRPGVLCRQESTHVKLQLGPQRPLERLPSHFPRLRVVHDEDPLRLAPLPSDVLPVAATRPDELAPPEPRAKPQPTDESVRLWHAQHGFHFGITQTIRRTFLDSRQELLRNRALIQPTR